MRARGPSRTKESAEVAGASGTGGTSPKGARRERVMPPLSARLHPMPPGDAGCFEELGALPGPDGTRSRKFSKSDKSSNRDNSASKRSKRRNVNCDSRTRQ